MITASPRFLANLRESHAIIASCELAFPDQPAPVSVPVESGSITIDRTAEIRRVGQITIPWDETLDLRTLPLGGYATVRRGIRYGDGSTELMKLGVLRIESVSWNAAGTSANLELADRMAQVRDEPFTTTYNADQQTPAQAVQAIISGVFGTAIGYRILYQPAGIFYDVTFAGGRSDALNAIEESFAAESYFDANGDFVFTRRPTAGDPPVWTVDAGTGGVMLDAGESLDRTGIYNGVSVRGQPAADKPPVEALSVLSDPTNPLRWGGPFGRVALLTESSTVTTVQQAQSTATSLLQLRLKRTHNLSLASAPNPALEAGDTILVRFPDGRQQNHLIDSVSVDLGTDAQTITTRTLESPGAITTIGGAIA
jgi:hypothetical protein